VKLISNVGLLNEAKSFHAQLQPVVNASDRLQSDNATIADFSVLFHCFIGCLFYPPTVRDMFRTPAAIQRTQTQFERRAFSVCGPDMWNSLPPSVCTVDSNSSFRRALKTHLFQFTFNN